jgi:hypothetical protein
MMTEKNTLNDISFENRDDLREGDLLLRNWIYSYLKYSPALTLEQQMSVKSRLKGELGMQQAEKKNLEEVKNED